MSSHNALSPEHTDASVGSDGRPPPLVALFLITFDLKIGYTISWKRAADGVTLDGVVEYKSLPSGLHNVDQDLVYFFHDNYAGISAFAKGDAGAEARNARFVAVGCMVPLYDGRLGRGWLHAQNLIHLASELKDNPTDMDPLVSYWAEHRLEDGAERSSVQLSPFTVGQKASRTLSTVTISSMERQTLPFYHPALATTAYLDLFGPLIFPLHRAALLRKRILIIASAPIKQACEFVYVLSMLSSTPISLMASLQQPSEALARLRPLFSVGVHDIPFLEELSKRSTLETEDDDEESDQPENGPGWIACTTDEILGTKSNLHDLVVELPLNHTNHPRDRKRPTIKSSKTRKEVRATQRDLRRYNILRRAIQPLKEVPTQAADEQDNESQPLLRPSSSTAVEDDAVDDESDVVEPTTWSELAYTSFMWWASAGEKEQTVLDEENMDSSLLDDLADTSQHLADERRYKDEDNDETTLSAGDAALEPPAGQRDARFETAIIAYFHRLSKKIFEVSAEVVDFGQSEDGSTEDLVKIDREALRSMGLDAWSPGDREYVGEFFRLWFRRDARVDPLEVECCGVRIC